LQALDVARELFDITGETKSSKSAKVHAAVELYLTTGEDQYKNYLLEETAFITQHIDRVGWFLGRAEKKMNNAPFTKAIRDALLSFALSWINRVQKHPTGYLIVPISGVRAGIFNGLGLTITSCTPLILTSLALSMCTMP